MTCTQYLQTPTTALVFEHLLATILLMDSRNKPRHRSPRPWKKLLWVKQSFPDNYTDETTFLDHLQRNPRLQPYEFWTLVADSTIIVQHVCSVLIFICAFTAIFQERVSPNAVVGWASFGTVGLWLGRGWWMEGDGNGEREGREWLRVATSGVLIYFSLLGLSPILRSLTTSTSSDSIWALSSLLLGINVFSFDYGAGAEATFPASLSTNAAIMASTVLASRLPTTTHVFSLTLFSIEVFGLFPIFRRHLKHQSWNAHLWLTILLVVVASGGLGMVISGGGFGYAVLGVILGGLTTSMGMGMTSWWLIGLQRYKNEIHGPWDPARPVIRRGWD
jgi:phosphatidylinositol glycan class C protein